MTIPTQKLEATRAAVALQLLATTLAKLGETVVTDAQAEALVKNATALAKPLADAYGLLLGVHDQGQKGTG